MAIFWAGVGEYSQRDSGSCNAAHCTPMQSLETQLEGLGQEDEQARRAVEPVCQALVRDDLLRCPDKASTLVVEEERRVFLIYIMSTHSYA